VLRKLVLEKAGYRVLAADSLRRALEVLSSSQVDLVLSDQLMPGGTGTELARQVKALFPRLPVIIISGVNELPSDANNADLFISKTEGPAAMCENIASVLKKNLPRMQ
jgi:CheY-like chemotaxis protein